MEIKQLKYQLKALEKKYKKASTGGGGGNQKSFVKPMRKPLPKGKFYCSSCGTNPTHSSKKCEDKQSWHNDKATFKNQMGGNTQNNHLWNDESIPFKVLVGYKWKK